MKHQQTVYLQEMGITRWLVRKPELFNNGQHNEILNLGQYDLLVICSDNDFVNPLMDKILQAFKFTTDKVFHCTLTDFENYRGELPEYIWSTVGNIEQVIGHKLLNSVSVSELESDPEEKRALWEQFCAFNQQ
jgi:DNA polymerase-3 subunit psi